MSTRLGHAVAAFGRFWWDFLVGDTPEFAVATAVIIGLSYLLNGTRWAAAIVLPILTAAFLVASTYRGRRRTAPGTRATPDPGAPDTDSS